MKEIDIELESIQLLLDKRQNIFVHYENGNSIRVVTEHGKMIIKPSTNNSVIIEVEK